MPSFGEWFKEYVADTLNQETSNPKPYTHVLWTLAPTFSSPVQNETCPVSCAEQYCWVAARQQAVSVVGFRARINPEPQALNRNPKP